MRRSVSDGSADPRSLLLTAVPVYGGTGHHAGLDQFDRSVMRWNSSAPAVCGVPRDGLFFSPGMTDESSFTVCHRWSGHGRSFWVFPMPPAPLGARFNGPLGGWALLGVKSAAPVLCSCSCTAWALTHSLHER